MEEFIAIQIDTSQALLVPASKPNWNASELRIIEVERKLDGTISRVYFVDKLPTITIMNSSFITEKPLSESEKKALISAKIEKLNTELDALNKGKSALG